FGGILHSLQIVLPASLMAADGPFRKIRRNPLRIQRDGSFASEKDLEKYGFRIQEPCCRETSKAAL
ncbi:MAG: hypothetical protein AAF725_21665, partial [Acidobacteriota bacterium]